MSDKVKIRLSFLGAIICWLLFAGSSIYLLFVQSYDMKVDFSNFFPQLCFTGFVLATFAYYRYMITKADSLNFTDLLWKVFITGLVTTLLSLAIRFFLTIFANSTLVESPLTINFFYNILIGLVVIFMVSTMVVWKRLILYQKSKNLLQLWGFFEVALLAALIFDFLGFSYGDQIFSVALVILGSFSIILAFNLKWVAYLNFKQKWKGILFILLSGIYLYHFLLMLFRFSYTEVLVIDLLDRAFIAGMFGFLFVYAVISILVTLFNLPTSSVFEQKLKEALDFQKLSQSIPRGETKDQTYEILLESSMSAVFADAAWLEVREESGTTQVIRNLKDEDVDIIKSAIKGETIKEILNLSLKSEANPGKLTDDLKHPQFKSIIALPIMVQNKQVGFIVLLNEVSEAFNREMVNIITTFVNQASISLENLSLIQESIENERYKEQLKIAKNVQKSLLPTSLINNDHLTMAAFSMAADEVGGDYYDILEYKKNRFSLIIGDVSGKGTSAAFQMAQMKGIFHSLASQGVSPEEFNKKANIALSQCLEKTSFITATYFDIDTTKNVLHFSRAGHCPSLFYCKNENSIDFLKCDGMGLGMLRNSSYGDYVHSNTVNYHAGDTLLLYTDGITEAKNPEGEQYGSERLKKAFTAHASKAPNQVKEGIKKDLSDFIGEMIIDDDYTLVVVQFKDNKNG
ncbi:GAF domain-containing SpoIIE family protein phosphatase [Ekhidna sp.]|uniref:GAF domain-containing SpoIIE family protein phosphatase n=1 Tax=Ekhidna sp. TaxID=2608089 RepID=UPI003C7CA8B7